MDDKFTYSQWPEDCVGFTQQGSVKRGGGCMSLFNKKKASQPYYRYQESAVGRDAATRFYDNPSMLMVGCQRVAVVDQDAGEVMICTPARAAAYIILRNRGRKDAVVGDIHSLDHILQDELDAALRELHARRNGTIKTDAAENGDVPTKIIIKEGDADGRGQHQTWECTGFAPQNGGWAKFLSDVMTEGNRWMAVMQGQTSPPEERIQSAPGKFDLVFLDTECELLYGEGRRFTLANPSQEILGVQLRRGYCVIRPAPLEDNNNNTTDDPKEEAMTNNNNKAKLRYDQFILPRGLSAGVFSNQSRQPRPGLIWRIRPDQALTHYTVGEEVMQIE